MFFWDGIAAKRYAFFMRQHSASMMCFVMLSDNQRDRTTVSAWRLPVSVACSLACVYSLGACPMKRNKLLGSPKYLYKK